MFCHCQVWHVSIQSQYNCGLLILWCPKLWCCCCCCCQCCYPVWCCCLPLAGEWNSYRELVHRWCRHWTPQNFAVLGIHCSQGDFECCFGFFCISARCRLLGCKNRARSIFWLEVIKGIPNQGVVFVLAKAVCLLCFGCMQFFVSLFLVVSTSAIDCLERLVSEITCYVPSGTLNPTNSLCPLYPAMA